MSSESPSQPAEPDPCDQPVDAVVYDMHPALAESQAYPYGSQAGDGTATAMPPSPAGQSLADAVTGLAGGVEFFFRRLSRPPDFAVPKRFGLSAILGITTALALLFGGLKWGEAHPVFYLFFGAQALVICLVQMFAGQAPRASSAIAGAIIMPLFAWGAAAGFAHRAPSILEMACLTVILVPAGALVGYITGTCAAGVFLIMDRLEPYLNGRASAGSGGHTAGA